MQSGHHHCLYAQLLEEDVQVSLEKAAVASLRHYIVLLTEVQL